MELPVHLLLSDQEATAFRRSRKVRRVALASGLIVFVIVLIVVIPPVLRHAEAVASFVLVGATVDWHVDKANWTRGGVTHVDFYNGKTLVTDTALRRLKELHAVESLDLADCEFVTESGLDALKDLPALKQLDLSRTQPMPNFFTRDSPPRRLTDAALVPLEKMTQLTNLSLAGDLITDDGLARLSGLTNLEVLDLQDTLVSDAGLKHLKGLKRLKRLTLSGTKVSKKGAMAFEQSLGGITDLSLGEISGKEVDADGDR